MSFEVTKGQISIPICISVFWVPGIDFRTASRYPPRRHLRRPRRVPTRRILNSSRYCAASFLRRFLRGRARCPRQPRPCRPLWPCPALPRHVPARPAPPRLARACPAMSRPDPPRPAPPCPPRPAPFRPAPPRLASLRPAGPAPPGPAPLHPAPPRLALPRPAPSRPAQPRPTPPCPAPRGPDLRCIATLCSAAFRPTQLRLALLHAATLASPQLVPSRWAPPATPIIGLPRPTPPRLASGDRPASALPRPALPHPAPPGPTRLGLALHYAKSCAIINFDGDCNANCHGADPTATVIENIVTHIQQF
jgi:hypothetical protein